MDSGCEHAADHAKSMKHQIAIQIFDRRIWCFACSCEVALNSNGIEIVAHLDHLLLQIVDQHKKLMSPSTTPVKQGNVDNLRRAVGPTVKFTHNNY